jgi:hypothetical protein
MGRAVYLLASSPWAGDYRNKIDTYIARIEKVATLLTEKANYTEWEGHITYYDKTQFTHRCYMMAAALGMASTLTRNDADAKRWASMADDIAKRGLSLQKSNGVNPERGGYDVQYQMYGVWLSLIYRSSLPADSDMRERIAAMADKAIAWEASRIDPDTGTIVIKGSTRICRDIIWTSGTTSAAFDPAEAIRVFLLWGYLTGNKKWITDAQTVDHAQKTLGHTCPPPDKSETTTTAA